MENGMAKWTHMVSVFCAVFFRKKYILLIDLLVQWFTMIYIDVLFFSLSLSASPVFWTFISPLRFCPATSHLLIKVLRGPKIPWVDGVACQVDGWPSMVKEKQIGLALLWPLMSRRKEHMLWTKSKTRATQMRCCRARFWISNYIYPKYILWPCDGDTSPDRSKRPCDSRCFGAAHGAASISRSHGRTATPQRNCDPAIRCDATSKACRQNN